MQEFWVAFGKIGGLAVIGGIIDLAISKKEEERIINCLIAWWVRFDDIEWSEFGQAEAQSALALIDRFAGSRFFSVRRCAFVLGISVFAYLCSLTWATYAVWREIPPTLPFLTWSQFLNEVVLTLRPASEFAALVVSFALSIAVTRAISNFVAHSRTGLVRTSLLFGALVLTHLFLIATWTRTLVPGLVLIASELPFFVVGSDNLLRWRWDFFLGHMRSELLGALLDFTWLSTALNPNTIVWSPGPYLPITIISALHYTQAIVFAILLDVVSNGLRIAFALIFFGCFVFRPVVKPLVSRLWAGLIDKKKPIFATLFGIIGAVIVLAGALLG